MSHIEIFVLNYNGARFLPDCLGSLLQLNKGCHSIGISVVDNASTDESAELVTRFDEINFIGLAKNSGFSKGNNLGVKKRIRELRKKGIFPDYLCFLNNDTRVDKEWLTSAIARFETDGSIGIVGSKSLFFDSYLDVRLSICGPYSDINDLSCLRLQVVKESENINSDPKRTKWIGWSSPDESSGRYSKVNSRILLAVEDPNIRADVRLILENRGNVPLEVTTVFANHEKNIAIQPYSMEDLCLSVPPQDFSKIIQNAGSFVTKCWNAGDIAMFSPEAGVREDACEVSAVCGVSMFIRRSLFEKLKGFDENFFAYYEDVDLSLRARAEGYSCWYEPKSRLHHIHCGSGGEWSPYFILNVTFSQLVFSSRWMSLSQFVKKIMAALRQAWLELRRYAEDQELENKPNLVTMIRCFKRPLMIPLNRIYHLRHSLVIPSLPMVNPKEKYSL